MARSVDVKFDDLESLLDEYTAIYKGYQSLESTDQPSNSANFQVRRRTTTTTHTAVPHMG